MTVPPAATCEVCATATGVDELVNVPSPAQRIGQFEQGGHGFTKRKLHCTAVLRWEVGCVIRHVLTQGSIGVVSEALCDGVCPEDARGKLHCGDLHIETRSRDLCRRQPG